MIVDGQLPLCIMVIIIIDMTLQVDGSDLRPSLAELIKGEVMVMMRSMRI